MSAELSTLVTAAGGAFLGKFVGPIAEHYGKAALERLQCLGAKAEQLLTSVSREPQPVEPRLLVPLVQAASLEADKSLADKWAALLANAADPLGEFEITPVYADILRQLTPAQARLLDVMFAEVSNNPTEPNPDFNTPAHKRDETTRRTLDLRRVFHQNTPSEELNNGNLACLEQQQRFEAMLDNFLRHQIINLDAEQSVKPKSQFNSGRPERTKAFFTLLGYDFMLACMPPRSQPIHPDTAVAMTNPF